MADILGVEDLVTHKDQDIFTQQNSRMDMETAQVTQTSIQSVRELTFMERNRSQLGRNGQSYITSTLFFRPRVNLMYDSCIAI
jgi:hypothetical protein